MPGSRNLTGQSASWRIGQNLTTRKQYYILENEKVDIIKN